MLERDPKKAKEAREDGIRRADENAGVVWRTYARGKLVELARKNPTVHADDLRLALGEDRQPRTPSATGPVFTWAAREGYLRKTGEKKYSELASNHSEHPIWESLIYEGPEGKALSPTTTGSTIPSGSLRIVGLTPEMVDRISNEQWRLILNGKIGMKGYLRIRMKRAIRLLTEGRVYDDEFEKPYFNARIPG